MQNFILASESTPRRPLISVCCICQRQRTSLNTWTTLDLSQYDTEVDLTHGFCPDCIRKHYPHVMHLVEVAA